MHRVGQDAKDMECVALLGGRHQQCAGLIECEAGHWMCVWSKVCNDGHGQVPGRCLGQFQNVSNHDLYRC
ncbi:hypothetical protein G6F42_029002 [Rhizopus arrhizus]|nr:hypothetical protein G6F42_029002 [Rhizopus arrhizus]